MTVSFDGMRKNATRSMDDLSDILKEVIELKSYEEVDIDLKKRIIKAFNDSAMRVEFFNCLYDDNIEGDTNDLSDWCVTKLEEIEEEDES